MSKADEAIVERVVTGPKGIHAKRDGTGERYYAEVGETVKLSLRSAKKFARYLTAPGVIAAQEEVKKAEAAANVEIAKANAEVVSADADTAEADRRAALSEEERAEEDRRAALPDEERQAEDDANAS